MSNILLQITSNLPKCSTSSKINGPLDTTMSLLHQAHKGRWITLLENIYIQLFQWCNTVITEQSQKDSNPFFVLVYNIQLTHACAWPPPTFLPYVTSFQYRVVCHIGNINTPLFGMHFTDKCFISLVLYIIFIHQCIIS